MPRLLYVDPMFNDPGLRNVIRHYYRHFHHNQIFPVSDGDHAERDIFGKGISIDAVLLGLGTPNLSSLLDSLQKKYGAPPLFLCGSRTMMKQNLDGRLKNYPNVKGRYGDIYLALKSDPFVQLKEEIRKNKAAT